VTGLVRRRAVVAAAPAVANYLGTEAGDRARRSGTLCGMNGGLHLTM
jgi:hypothetical protein